MFLFIAYSIEEILKKILGCKDIKLTILRGVSTKLTEEWKTRHVSGHQHHHEICQCEFGKLEKREKRQLTRK